MNNPPVSDLNRLTISDLELELEIVALQKLLYPENKILSGEVQRLSDTIKERRGKEATNRKEKRKAFWQTIATRQGQAKTAKELERLKEEVETYQNGFTENDPERIKAKECLESLTERISWLQTLEKADACTKEGDAQASNWKKGSLEEAEKKYQEALKIINLFQQENANVNEAGLTAAQVTTVVSSAVELRLRKAELERKITKIEQLLFKLSADNTSEKNAVEKTIGEAELALQMVNCFIANGMKAEAAKSPKLEEAVAAIRLLREWRVTDADPKEIEELINTARGTSTEAGLPEEVFKAQITPSNPGWAEVVLVSEAPEQPDDGWVHRLETAVGELPDFKYLNPGHGSALRRLIAEEGASFWEEINDKGKKASALKHLHKLLHYTALSRQLSSTATTSHENGSPASNRQRGGIRRIFSSKKTAPGSPRNVRRLQDLIGANGVENWLKTNDARTAWQQAVAYQPKAKGVDRRFLIVWGVSILLFLGLMGGFFIGQAQGGVPAASATVVANVTTTIAPAATATSMPDIGATVVSALLTVRPTLDAARPAESPTPDVAQTVIAAMLTAQATITPTAPIAPATATPDLVPTIVSAILTAQATLEVAPPSETPPSPDNMENSDNGAVTSVPTDSPTAISEPISEIEASRIVPRYYRTLDDAKALTNAPGLLPSGPFTILYRDESSVYIYFQTSENVSGWTLAQYVALPAGIDLNRLPVRDE